MTNAFDAQFDELAHAAFREAGMAEMGAFEPQTGPAIANCRLYVDRDLATSAFGGAGVVRSGSLSGVEFLKGQAILSLFKADVPVSPKRGDAVVVGSERFVVQRPVAEDESLWGVLCQA